MVSWGGEKKIIVREDDVCLVLYKKTSMFVMLTSMLTALSGDGRRQEAPREGPSVDASAGSSATSMAAANDRLMRRHQTNHPPNPVTDNRKRKRAIPATTLRIVTLETASKIPALLKRSPSVEVMGCTGVGAIASMVVVEEVVFSKS